MSQHLRVGWIIYPPFSQELGKLVQPHPFSFSVNCKMTNWTMCLNEPSDLQFKSKALISCIKAAGSSWHDSLWTTADGPHWRVDLTGFSDMYAVPPCFIRSSTYLLAPYLSGSLLPWLVSVHTARQHYLQGLFNFHECHLEFLIIHYCGVTCQRI